MSDLSYQHIRSTHQAREADEKRTINRKKNVLLLMMHYLNQEGFTASALSLSNETNLDFQNYQVCDNVDLETILMEYESYYFVKFQKYPHITKRLIVKSDNQKLINSSGDRVKKHKPPVLQIAATHTGDQLSDQKINRSLKSVSDNAHVNGKNSPQSASGGQKDTFPSITSSRSGSATLPSICGTTMNGRENQQNGVKKCSITPGGSQAVPRTILDVRSMIQQETRMTPDQNNGINEHEERLLKPLGGYAGYTGEWRELALTISREIFLQNPNVHWNDIIGLDEAKQLVKESVVYPIKYPQLFTGILSPWKGLLLYGPPGTGKTLLAKAVATECKTTFFNISASTIVSKWRGDSEKLVRVLFELARFHAPSTIFLDELDSLMSQRGAVGGLSSAAGGSGGGGEHEGSRRMKTELLMQMDGLSKSDDLVFLLAASNLPWELDHAMLRRLEKRILVDLPIRAARRRMFECFLPAIVSPEASDQKGLQLKYEIDYDLAADATDGYSGSDIRLVCKEAAMRVVRKVFDVLEHSKSDDDLSKRIHLDPVQTEDVLAAIACTMPSANQLVNKYQEWEKQFGSF